MTNRLQARLSDAVVIVDNPFANCKLDRQQYAVLLTQAVQLYVRVHQKSLFIIFLRLHIFSPNSPQ